MLQQLFDNVKSVVTKPKEVVESWQEDDRLKERMNTLIRVQQKFAPDLNALALDGIPDVSQRLRDKFAAVAAQFVDTVAFHKDIPTHIAEAKEAFAHRAAGRGLLKGVLAHAVRPFAESHLTFSRGKAGIDSSMQFALGQKLLDMKSNFKAGTYNEEKSAAALTVIADILDANMKDTKKYLREIAGEYDPEADREAHRAKALVHALLTGQALAPPPTDSPAP